MRSQLSLENADQGGSEIIRQRRSRFTAAVASRGRARDLAKPERERSAQISLRQIARLPVW
jgi:hypothetical protein